MLNRFQFLPAVTTQPWPDPPCRRAWQPSQYFIPDEALLTSWGFDFDAGEIDGRPYKVSLGND